MSIHTTQRQLRAARDEYRLRCVLHGTNSHSARAKKAQVLILQRDLFYLKCTAAQARGQAVTI